MTSQLNWHFVIAVIYLLRTSDLTRLFPSEEGRSKVMSTSLEWTASPLEEVFVACGSASFPFSLYSVDATVHMVMVEQNKMVWDANYEMRLWRDKKTLKLEGMLGEGMKRFQYLRNIYKSADLLYHHLPLDQIIMPINKLRAKSVWSED